jgi:uncharacterized membrane protein
MIAGMATIYNRIAGESIERIAALSDGVFAVAMTLLVLDLKAPVESAIHTEGDLWRGLVALAPRLLVYMMSFVTLSIFWVGQQTQLNQHTRADRDLAWLHLIFLFTITLMPFSTGLIGEFIEYRVALLVYWLNILLPGAMLYASWGYATRAKLLREDISPERVAAICRRIVIAQALYAFGAALCVFNTWCSIGVIVVVQLNYAIAPRMGVLGRI